MRLENYPGTENCDMDANVQNSPIISTKIEKEEKGGLQLSNY
jgi:hypothetical protein